MCSEVKVPSRCLSRNGFIVIKAAVGMATAQSSLSILLLWLFHPWKENPNVGTLVELFLSLFDLFLLDSVEEKDEKQTPRAVELFGKAIKCVTFYDRP